MPHRSIVFARLRSPVAASLFTALSAVLLAGGIAEGAPSAAQPGSPATPAPTPIPATAPVVETPAPVALPGPGSPFAVVGPARPRPAVAPAAVNLSQDPRPTLTPATFLETMRAAERYRRIADEGGWPAMAAGTVLKPGDRGPLVAALKARLRIEGDLGPAEGADADLLDEPVAAAVRRFQVRHGLPESGAVRARTLAAMNVPAGVRARQLQASAMRLAGTSFPFGERYVVVNIPAAAVEAVEGGQVRRRHVAVVGKKDRPSPQIMARITSVNLNPTWTVPASVIRKDIIPQMRKDAGYLAKQKIRILDYKGNEIDPAALDWSTEKAADYLLRQDPGAANSLGQVRIDMPNKQAVYLHDTPKKSLFAQDSRFHSSGCVRVADVRAFVAWLLEGTASPAGGAWDAAALDAGIASGERQDVKLAKAVPVAWVYLTGYATADGAVHFRDDVYGLDEPRPDPAGEDLMTSSIAPRRKG